MIARGREVLELRDERNLALMFDINDLDGIIAGLELVRKSEREGLEVREVTGAHFSIHRWRATA